MPDEMQPGDSASQFFAFFTEIGIISQLSRALLEQRLPDGATVAHYGVLNHLIRVSDGRTPLDLARAFQVPKTTMSHTLAGLEKRGFIEMRPNEKDSRSKRVWLTDAGRDFRNSAVGLLAADIERLSKSIDVKTVEALVPELAKIRKVLDEDRNS